MKIEEAIKQTKPFDNAYQKLSVNLMFTNNWIVSNLHRFFKTYDITLKQYNILRILNGAKVPVSTNFIKDRLLDKMSDVSRIVDRMESKSLVKKTICETDKRKVDVSLTSKGKKFLQEIKLNIDVMRNLFDNLTEGEAEQLSDLLDKIRINKYST